MRDISNFGNNLRDEIIEYRLEHETGYVIKPKFVDKDDKTYVCFSLYSKSGDLLSDSEPPVLFDPAGQRVIDDVKLIKGSDEGRDAEYEIKVTFKGSRDPIYCQVDDILTTNKKYVDKYVDDYMSGAKLASGISITADGQLKIGDAVLNEATLTKLIALAESMTETKEK